MSIWDHISELRNRLMKIGASVLIAALVAWNYREKLLHWLTVPYERAWIERYRGIPILENLPPELQTLSPTDPISGYFQLSIITAIVVTIPVIFYQLWAFISPGLYARERRFIVPFVVFSSTLFLSGVAFGYYVFFPFFFKFSFSLLGRVGDEGTAVLTQKATLSEYLDFTTRALLAMGFTFELPILITFLVIAGFVTRRQLIRFSRWAIIISLIIGAIVSPGPDVMSQLIISGAIIALYFLSIVLSFFVVPRKREPKPAQ